VGGDGGGGGGLKKKYKSKNTHGAPKFFLIALFSSS